MTRPRALLAIVAILTLGTNNYARAGFTINLKSVDPINSGAYAGDYLWTYEASIASTDKVSSAAGIPGPNFFQMFDFTGYVPGTATAPAGWSASTPAFQPPPPPARLILLYGDDPAVPNLRFDYVSGPTLSGATLANNTIPGVFTAISTYSVPGATKDFVGQLLRSDDGSLVDSGGNILVPVPEPVALISTGLGLATLGLAAWLRRKAPLAA